MSKKSTQIRDGRYVQGGTVQQSTRLLGWWERRVLRRDDSDVTITLTPKYSGRPDLLAFDVYGRTSLTWLVLQYNNIVDIQEEFTEGAEIILPTNQRVHTEILTKVV